MSRISRAVARGGQGGRRHGRPRRRPHARCARSGARCTGRCPFHDERSPSFSVDPVEEESTTASAAGASGDAIGFVQETENLDFVGAVEWLADRYGVELEYEESSPQAGAPPRRAAAPAGAARGRRRLLRALPVGVGRGRAGPGLPGRARAREDQTARDFRLGFAPTAWDRVCAAARAKGFTAGRARAGGALEPRPARARRPLPGRLMFPLADARGRVRGFGARQMPGGEPPKYLNSPGGHALSQVRGRCTALDRARTRDRGELAARSWSRATPTCSRCIRPG